MPESPDIILITGLSGSGKTTALHALEDAGWFCMDNLPVVLLPKVVELAGSARPRIAVVVDVRDTQFITQAPGVLDQLEASGVHVHVLFLDADDESLITRFSETRRRHPLATAGIGVAEAVALERRTLDELHHRATLLINTSRCTVHDLKRQIQERFADEGSRTMDIHVVSFGFRHGQLPEADLLFDVRFLPNPFFIPELKDTNGLDPACSAFVLAQPQTNGFLERVTPLLNFIIPLQQNEGKAYLTIAFGCTGGRHRSVAVAEDVARALRQSNPTVTVTHRDRPHWPAV
jgi:UPF0042 nucleotide-binding protein